MQTLLKWTLMLLQLSLTLTWTAADTPSPYCYRNITETSYKVVTKSRIKTVSAKGFFKKISFKKETKVEVYEDTEPVYKIKVELYCCEGYKMTDLDLCEPQCEENGCPQHSKCVEPEVCECLKGYFSTRSAQDGRHYCEPICEKPCPEQSVCVAPNECACKKGFQVTEDKQCKPFCASGCPHQGQCVSPNVCECQEGYKAEKGSCLATCSLGDQCLNGQCVNTEQCVCNQGYEWNNERSACELNAEYGSTSTNYPEFSEPQQPTESMEIETDIETSNEDFDPNQVFDEDIESSTFSSWTDEYGYSTTSSSLEGKNHKCPNDYVYHEGQCRPLKFASKEIDCWLKPCQDQHAVCLENGTCACTEEFKTFRTHIVDHNSPHQTVKVECLSDAEYEERVQQLKLNSEKTIIEKHIDWITIFFTVLGVLIIIIALVLLGFKLLFKQRGKMNVEGKNLACVYEHRACSITDKNSEKSHV